MTARGRKRLVEIVRALRGESDFMQSYAARLAIQAARPMPIPAGMAPYPFVFPKQTGRADSALRAFSHPFRPSGSTNGPVESGRQKGQRYRRETRQVQEPLSSATFLAAAGLMRKVFIRYVDTWCEVKPNFKRWVEENPRLSDLLVRAVHQTRYKLLPTTADGAILSRASPSFGSNRLRAKAAYDAAWLFIELVTGSIPYEVGRCFRCKGHYLNFSGHRNKVYCSRRCATAVSAERAMRQRRMKQKRDKLKRAEEAYRAFRAARYPAVDWKRWVAKRAGLTPTWLTRAINRGELRLAMAK